MSEFARDRRTGQVIATFNEVEARLLESLATQLVELLGEDQPQARDSWESMFDFSGPTGAPQDPVLARLLPDAYPADDEAGGEFRRFTEPGIRQRKARVARVVLESLAEAGLPEASDGDLTLDVELDDNQADDWARALTDIRIALGVRLGVEANDERRWARMRDTNPVKQTYHVYAWLGAVQESLVECLLEP